MTIKVGSARIDERGHAHSGRAGDQTGKELSTQNYYKHSKGWVVLRPKTAEQANKIAKDMLYACANHHIGYDQYQRNTLYNIAKDVGFNCSLVNKNCETDCSALVRVCLAYAGIDVENFRTYNQRSVLLKSGQFTDVTSKVNTSTGKGLCIGDVLVTKTHGHTVVVVSGATKRGSKDTFTNKRVGEFQRAYNADYHGKLAVDDKLGLKTKDAISKVLLKEQDNAHPNMTRFIQRYVGADVDGKYGHKTEEAVKAYQRSHGLTVDGHAGAKTITTIIKKG